MAKRHKVPYSKSEAEEQLVLRYSKTRKGGHIYRCAKCGWWHLTSKPNSTKYKNYGDKK